MKIHKDPAYEILTVKQEVNEDGFFRIKRKDKKVRLEIHMIAAGTKKILHTYDTIKRKR